VLPVLSKTHPDDSPGQQGIEVIRVPSTGASGVIRIASRSTSE
jgi:hypothetical protein